jgi:hypothetical protein
MMITDFNKNKNPLARLLTQKVTHSRHNDYRLQAKQISRVRESELLFESASERVGFCFC